MYIFLFALCKVIVESGFNLGLYRLPTLLVKNTWAQLYIYICIYISTALRSHFSRCAARFNKAVVAFLQAMVWLNQHYESEGDEKKWRLKPKSHYLAELARIGCNPSNTWTYKDESFGGFAAELSKRRGGALTMLAVSRQLLSQYCASQDFPRASQSQRVIAV